MTRHLYIVRHGEADPFGEITPSGRRQARLLGERLAHVPIDAVWHSPLPRAQASAEEIARSLGAGTLVDEAFELVDHVPYVPTPEEVPARWRPFFDGYGEEEAEEGNRIARALVARFATAEGISGERNEVLVTHAYPIAWLLRDALGAAPARWLGLNSANTGLTIIDYVAESPPELVMFNDLSHLPPELRWTGFPGDGRP